MRQSLPNLFLGPT